MTIVASTLRSRPSGDVEKTAGTLLDTGFEALVLAGPLFHSDWAALEPLLPRDSILALELFAPLPRGVKPGQLRRGRASPFALGSLDPDEKREAEKQGMPTIVLAQDRGARYVLLPAIELDDPDEPRESDRATGQAGVRSAASRGESSGPRKPRRAPHVEAHLDSYLSTLDRLLQVADRYGVSLAVTPAPDRLRLPDADATERCLAEFRGAPLCVWPDTAWQARAESAAGEVPPWRRFEPVPGVTLHDVERSGRPGLPGQGSIDWDELLPQLIAVPRWVVDPPVQAEVHQIARALELVRGHLEPEPPDPLFSR